MNSYKITEFLFKNSTLLFLFSVLFSLASIVGFYKFSFSTDLMYLFSEDAEYKKRTDLLNSEYSDDDVIIIGVSQKDNNDDFNILKRENLKTITDIVELAKEIPLAYYVDGLTNYTYSFSIDDTLYSEEVLSDIVNIDDNELSKRIDFIANNDLLLGRLISKDQKMAGIYVSLTWAEEDHSQHLKDIAIYLDEMDAFIAKTNPNLKLSYTGSVMLEEGMTSLSRRDFVMLIPLIVVLNVLSLFFVVRSGTLVFLSFLIVQMSVWTTMGLACWYEIELNATSIMATTLIMVLVLAAVIHVLLNFLQFYQETGDKYQALFQSYEINMRPILFTALTTAVGFLMLNMSASPSFGVLGILAVVGVLHGLFFLAAVFPFLILRVPFKIPESSLGLQDAMENVGRFSVRYKNILFWFFIILIGIAASFVTNNKLNDDAFSYFDESLRFRQDTDLITSAMAGRRQIRVSLSVEDEGAINEPKFLRDVENFSLWLKDQPEVKKVYSYEDMLKSINRTMNDDVESFYSLPASRAEAAELLLTYEMNLPEGQNIDSYIKYDKSAIQLTAIINVINNEETLAFEREIKSWLDNNTSNIQGYVVGGVDLMFADLGVKVLKTMSIASIIAIFLISILLIWGLKSVKHGLISFIPNALPAVIVYGFWGLFVEEVNMSVAVTFSIALGLVVDDTVHLMSKYLDSVRQGFSAEESIVKAYRMTGPALLLTTVIVVSGCVIQSFSLFGVNAIVGLMTALMLSTALVFDLLFLPAILIFFSKHKYENISV